MSINPFFRLCCCEGVRICLACLILFSLQVKLNIGVFVLQVLVYSITKSRRLAQIAV